MLATGGGGRASAAPPFKANTIGFLDAKTLKPAGSVDQLGAPDVLFPGAGGGLWAYDISAGSVAQIHPSTSQITTRFPMTRGPGGWLAVGGSLWFGEQNAAAVDRVDPTYGNITRRIVLPTRGLPGGASASWLAYGAGSLWVSYGSSPIRIARIDPATNRVSRTIDLQTVSGAPLLAFGGGSLWAVNQNNGAFWRIDPAANAVVASNKLHDGWVEDLRVVGGYAWMPQQYDGGVWKVDPRGNIIGLVPTGDVPYATADDGRYLYVANARSGTVSRVDPETDAVTTVRVGHRPQSIAVAGGRIWLSLAQSSGDLTADLAGKKVLNAVARGDPFGVSDPALACCGRDLQLEDAVGARLLRYPDVAGAKGMELVPELSDLPTVSNGGRTYTFRIRPGYRFSPPSNAPVTAEVMRYTIERAVSPKLVDPLAQGASIVTDIAGLDAYRAGKAAHVSGIRVDGDRLSITLVKPAPDFPARISMPYFSAVPLGTPALPHGVGQPIPSAGPYYLSLHVSDVTDVLKRNPNYHGPRPHAFDAFTFENDVGYEPGTLRVAHGGGDYAAAEVPPYPTDLEPTGPLARLYGAGTAEARNGRERYFDPPAGIVRYLQFNATSGPLRDASIRRAINYALDRKALAAALDAAPWDSIVVPGFPGAGGAPVYPLNGPDLARARGLMHGRHVHLVFYTSSATNCPYCPLVTPIVASNLAAIGITLDVRTPQDRFGAASDPHARWDLLLVTWGLTYPDPSDVVNNLFDPGTSLGYGDPIGWDRYADKTFLARMRATYRVGGTARAAAYRQLVAQMFRQSPPAAVFASQNGPPQLFSSRIGCQVFRPQYGGYVDLPALCIRSKK